MPTFWAWKDKEEEDKKSITSYQHRGAQVKLVEELRDEDVNLEDIGDVLALHVAQHVDEPLEVLVGRADPEEVHLKNDK